MPFAIDNLDSMSKRRVVVTGMGIVSPVGIGLDAAWADILAARSGITAITRFDASAFPSRIAGEVKAFDVTKYLSGKEARRYDTFIHYGWCDHGSRQDAGLDGCGGDLERVRSASTCISGLPMIEDTSNAYRDGGPLDLAVLARVDQHDLRTGVDPLWIQGTEPRAGHRVLDRESQSVKRRG